MCERRHFRESTRSQCRKCTPSLASSHPFLRTDTASSFFGDMKGYGALNCMMLVHAATSRSSGRSQRMREMSSVSSVAIVSVKLEACAVVDHRTSTSSLPLIPYMARRSQCTCPVVKPAGMVAVPSRTDAVANITVLAVLSPNKRSVIVMQHNPVLDGGCSDMGSPLNVIHGTIQPLSEERKAVASGVHRAHHRASTEMPKGARRHQGQFWEESVASWARHMSAFSESATDVRRRFADSGVEPSTLRQTRARESLTFPKP